MKGSTIKFRFDKSVPMDDVDATLRLSMLGAESLHGEDRVRLETRTRLDRSSRTVLIDAFTEVGRSLTALFGGYIRREFGEAAVRFEHSELLPESSALEVGA